MSIAASAYNFDIHASEKAHKITYNFVVVDINQ